ncbi:MAG: adenylate kinase [Thermotogae bacterium]|nr:adenylate kinase [Thermotogota bacterium]
MAHDGYRIVFLGPPGAGKGTQASLLAKKYGIKKISTGDILREAVRNGTELGRKAKRYMDAGELVPDGIIIGLIEEQIAGHESFILDGFPRTLVQAKALDELLNKQGKPLTHVIFVSVPDEEIVRRLTARRVCPKCGAVYNLVYNPPKSDEICDVCGTPLIQRSDDREDVIRNRLRVFKESTAPLVDYYRKRGIYHEVNGVGSVEEVLKRIEEALSG